MWRIADLLNRHKISQQFLKELNVLAATQNPLAAISMPNLAAAAGKIVFVTTEVPIPEEGSVAISAVAAGVPIVSKRLSDAVQDTDLVSYPTSTDTLLIPRMMTQNYVVFIALLRDADQFRIQVIGDLFTALTEIVHKIALNALGEKGLTGALDG